MELAGDKPKGPISGERAIEIVRKHVEASGGEVFADYSVSYVRSESEYYVTVWFGDGRNLFGNLTGYRLGGHAVYIVSQEGVILRRIPGA